MTTKELVESNLPNGVISTNGPCAEVQVTMATYNWKAVKGLIQVLLPMGTVKNAKVVNKDYAPLKGSYVGFTWRDAQPVYLESAEEINTYIYNNRTRFCTVFFYRKPKEVLVESQE